MTAAPSVGKAVDEYLAMRRALGFKMVRAPMLQDFTRYLKEHHAPFITTRLALLWAKRPVDVHPSHWATRLSVVRQFARHMSAFDPRTEIPPADLLPFRPPRREPYLYSDGELRQLLAATRTVASETGLRRFTYSTLIGLLAVTGMRISEAIALDDRDLDFTARVLTIRNTKFRKSRLVPLHS